MPNITVKNKRLKMSPAGVISLPVSARKALQMKKGAGKEIAVSVENKVLVLSAKGRGLKVSPKGQALLEGDAKGFLDRASKRHYYLVTDDAAGKVALYPY